MQKRLKKYENLGYPTGWYVVSMSKNLRNEKMLVVPFVGEELIIYRTKSGKVCITEPYCPHLGAHFGHGGLVKGENLYCPFHGFEFDTEGACVKTGYGTKPPPTAKLKMMPIKESNGFIFIYYDRNNETPFWEIPELDFTNWTKLIYKSFVISDHPQETTENSVDIGHFAFVHNYNNTTSLREAIFKDQYMSTKYSFEKPYPKPLHILNPKGQKIEIETHIYGLGYSMVDVKIPSFKYHIKMWVLPTPISPDKITLRLAMRKKKSNSKIFSLLLDDLISTSVLKGFVHDTRQDFKIWENKLLIEKPALAKGDGPIAAYRKWAKQFY